MAKVSLWRRGVDSGGMHRDCVSGAPNVIVFELQGCADVIKERIKRNLENCMQQVQVSRFGPILGRNRSRQLWEVSGVPPGIQIAKKSNNTGCACVG